MRFSGFQKAQICVPEKCANGAANALPTDSSHPPQVQLVEQNGFEYSTAPEMFVSGVLAVFDKGISAHQTIPSLEPQVPSGTPLFAVARAVVRELAVRENKGFEMSKKRCVGIGVWKRQQRPWCNFYPYKFRWVKKKTKEGLVHREKGLKKKRFFEY
jgi:hypothetical protein